MNRARERKRENRQKRDGSRNRGTERHEWRKKKRDQKNMGIKELKYKVGGYLICL